MGCCGPGKLPQKGKSPKWLGEGAKGLFLTLLGPREQMSPKSLLHHPNPFLHRCNPISHQCKRPLARGVQRRFAPSPNHFWKLSLFGQFPRSAASQVKNGFFFSQLFGQLRDTQPDPGASRQKVCCPWVWRNMPSFVTLTPSRRRPHLSARYPDQKVWVCAPFSCLTLGVHPSTCCSCTLATVLWLPLRISHPLFHTPGLVPIHLAGRCVHCRARSASHLPCVTLFGGTQRGGFQKGGFGGCSPGTKNRNEGTFGCSPGTKNRNEGTFACSPERNRNEGTFAKTTLLRNRPFISR